MSNRSGLSAVNWLALAAGMLVLGQAAAQDAASGGVADVERMAEQAGPFGENVLEDETNLLEAAAPVEIRYDRYTTATLRALDKITGRSTDIEVTVDEPVIFGSLRVTLKSCHQTPPELPPESAAFLEVDGVQAVQASEVSQVQTDASEQDAERLFSGWMFASSPGLSALEHPVYDIWTIRCTASTPVSGASGG